MRTASGSGIPAWSAKPYLDVSLSGGSEDLSGDNGVMGQRPMAVETCRRFRSRRRASEDLFRGAVWTTVLIVGLALIVNSCGPAPSTSAKPSLEVSASAKLVGGQQIQVRVSNFPAKATLIVYECGAVRFASVRGCDEPISGTLHTGTNGRASGPFVAQQAAGTGRNTATVACRNQCVLVALAIKVGTRFIGHPSPVATARLSFSTSAPPNLADSFLQDLSWVSTSDGWALAAQPCATGWCARLAHTTDGGIQWQMLPEPPAQIWSSSHSCSCVGRVRFATPAIGYLYGPSLLMTTDGGQSWKAEIGLQVETLAVADGAVFRVAYDHSGCPGPCQPTLQEARIGSGTWQTLVGQLSTPDRSGSAQIVSSGPDLLVAMHGTQAGPESAQATVYRSIDAGSSWQLMPDPCSGQGPAGVEDDLIDLASAPGGFFAGLCSPRFETGNFVVTSTDGGSSWQKAGALPAVQDLTQLAAGSPSTLAVSTGATSGVTRGFTAQLLVSTDMGQQWTTVASDTQQVTPMNVPAWLGFENSQVGRWIGDPHSVWTTQDGGMQWVQHPFH